MACTRQAFLRGRFSAKLVAEPALSISDRCLSLNGTVCRVCEEFCDEGAIRFRLLGQGRSEPVIDRERCTLCGACLPACPIEAISVEEQAT
ncbi:MAG: 4Fe-4S binding protein [Geminicoccaceae bacterium]